MKKFIENHPAAAAVMLMFITLFPLMALRDFTPANELRYLNITDEALAGGHFFAFTSQGEPYADKPPLYFWLMMLLKTIFGGHSMPALSMLSFIPAAVMMTVMDRWAVSASGTTGRPGFLTRFASSLMLGTSALFLGTSVFLRMDMLMCMFIVLALHSFYKLYTGQGNRKVQGILLPVYIFLALFTKGPVGLLVPPVSIIVFLVREGKVRDIGKYLGWKTWGILVLLCALWFAGVRLDGGREYLENLLFHQTLDRAVDAFHHKEPFWYYAVAMWYVLAPYSILLVLTFFSEFTRGISDSGNFRERSMRRLSVSVTACTFIMLSAFSSKLSIYLLPIFPFMVYMLPLLSGKFRWRAWHTLSLMIPASVFVVAGAGGIAVLVTRCVPALEAYGFAWSPYVFVALSLLAAGGILGMILVLKSRSWQLPVISLAVSVLAAAAVVSAVIPQANDYIGYRNVCKTAAEMASGSPGETGYVTLSVFRPDNMDVYLHEDIIDFGKDTGSYLDAGLGSHVLIVKTSAVSDDSGLHDRLQGLNPVQVGEYSLYLMPGHQEPQP